MRPSADLTRNQLECVKFAVEVALKAAVEVASEMSGEKGTSSIKDLEIGSIGIICCTQ